MKMEMSFFSLSHINYHTKLKNRIKKFSFSNNYCLSLQPEKLRAKWRSVTFPKTKTQFTLSIWNSSDKKLTWMLIIQCLMSLIREENSCKSSGSTWPGDPWVLVETTYEKCMLRTFGYFSEA